MKSLTIVHIAGASGPTEQRCVRCHEVLIDVKGMMAPIGSDQIHAWPAGSYIGRLGPGWILLRHDAEFGDEVKCTAETVQ